LYRIGRRDAGFLLQQPNRAARSMPQPTSRARHRRAIVFMIVAAVCWSSGGLLVRQL